MLSEPGLRHVRAHCIGAYRLITDKANGDTHIEMHACCCRFHQQELAPFSHFACRQAHSTFSWGKFAERSKSLLRSLEMSHWYVTQRWYMCIKSV